MKRYPATMRFSFFLLAIILFTYAVIHAKDFLYPITFGILLAYLLYPLTNFFEKQRLPRILSILLSLFFFGFTIFIATFFLYRRLSVLFDDMPLLKEQAAKNLENLLLIVESKFGISDVKFESFLKEGVDHFFMNIRNSINEMLFTTTETIFKIGILPVYIFLFLYYRTKFAFFILKAAKSNNKITVVHILRDISTIASKYMLGLFLVICALCVLNSFGLYIIGMQYPVVLGVLTACFAIVPYFGVLIGGTIPLALALLLSDDITMSVRVIILYAIIHSIENNILSPNIVGHNVKLSPLIIIIGLIAAAMVWGVPGMLVIVPFLAMFKIVINNVDSLHPYEYLMDPRGTKKHAIDFKKIFSFFSKKKSKS